MGPLGILFLIPIASTLLRWSVVVLFTTAVVMGVRLEPWKFF